MEAQALGRGSVSLMARHHEFGLLHNLSRHFGYPQ
jgi:hypothetical protein